MNKLGFGFLRLPKLGDDYDWQTVNAMVDAFLAGGGRYFDTCYTYLDGFSEIGIQKCLTSRKDRSAYRLCDKLPGYLCHGDEDCQQYLDESLTRCGVEWFDVLMLHWLNDKHYAIAQRYDQFRFLREQKERGIAKRIGFSFHGSSELLDKILTDHPEVDVVLHQLNYLDWDSAGIQSRACYETCMRHGKSVIVMEPVKGGTLAKLPPEAEAMLRQMHPDWSPADWALRFVQSLPGVEVCLSGMGSLVQVQENIRPFQPLTLEETALLASVGEIIRGQTAVGCTGCGYCLPHCPQKIPIPSYFQLYNELCRFPGEDWKLQPVYAGLPGGRASDCLSCHSCQSHCPQYLPISRHLHALAEKFEGK